MEDALTDIPPPSRFFHEDLNNFTPPSPPLPFPFLVFSNPNISPKNPLRPSLLIVAISSPSLYLVHQCIPSKTLIGTLILPENYFAGNSIEPSLKDKSCNIYALDENDQSSVLFICIQCPIASERSRAVAKTLMDQEQIIRPERVLILDSIQSRNFRGKLSPDETFAFKIETSLEQKEGVDSRMIECLDYFPSGSVIDGFAAAILARCQMGRIRGTMCVSWPEFGVSTVSLLKSLMLKGVLKSKLELSLKEGGNRVDDVGFNWIRDSRLDNELYT